MKIGQHATQKIIINTLSEVNKDRKNNPVTSFFCFYHKGKTLLTNLSQRQ